MTEATTGPVAARPEPYRAAKLVASVEIAAVGDVVAHGEVVASAVQADQKAPNGSSLNHGGYDGLFEGVRKELEPADIGFANLETPIAPKTGRKPRSFLFNAQPELLRALKRVGIDVVSFANNHVYDQGRRGFVETIDQLEASPLMFVGAGRDCQRAASARVVEANGIQIAFLAGTLLFNQRLNQGGNQPCAFDLDEQLVLRQAALARDAGAKLVILSVHWGSEYQTVPDQAEIGLAHRLLDGGVDVILGHHPHVLRPVEVYQAKDGRITLVAFSLGNFISNQSRFYVHGVQPAKMGNTRDGVILRFRVLRKDYGDGIELTELADLSVQPLWTDNNALLRRRDKKLPTIIRVVANDRELARARALLLEAKERWQIVELKKRVELLESRREIASQILGEDLLREPNPQPEADVE